MIATPKLPIMREQPDRAAQKIGFMNQRNQPQSIARSSGVPSASE